MTLKELIDQKSAGLFYIEPSASVLDAIQTMCANKVGSLLVQSDDGVLTGILTERDILLFCANRSSELSSVTIEEIMTRNPITAPQECSIEEAMTLMTERRFRHLPVIERNKPLAMVSIGDLVKSRLREVTVEAKYLREFISA